MAARSATAISRHALGAGGALEGGRDLGMPASARSA
jgi:hypothetical protein